MCLVCSKAALWRVHGGMERAGQSGTEQRGGHPVVQVPDMGGFTLCGLSVRGGSSVSPCLSLGGPVRAW